MSQALSNSVDGQDMQSQLYSIGLDAKVSKVCLDQQHTALKQLQATTEQTFNNTGEQYYLTQHGIHTLYMLLAFQAYFVRVVFVENVFIHTSQKHIISCSNCIHT